MFVDRALEGAVLMRAGLRTNARVRPTFQIKSSGNSRTRGGGRIRFRGKLPGPGCDGRIVKVQAKVGKRHWQVFRGIRTSDECGSQDRVHAQLDQPAHPLSVPGPDSGAARLPLRRGIVAGARRRRRPGLGPEALDQVGGALGAPARPEAVSRPRRAGSRGRRRRGGRRPLGGARPARARRWRAAGR